MWPHGEIEVEQPLQWCIQDIDIVFLEFLPPLFGIREKRVAATCCNSRGWSFRFKGQKTASNNRNLASKLKKDNLHDF